MENNKNVFAPIHVLLSLGLRSNPVAHPHLYSVSDKAKHNCLQSEEFRPHAFVPRKRKCRNLYSRVPNKRVGWKIC